MFAMVWHRPRELQQALKILDEQQPVVVCGGTDLFVNWPRRQDQYDGRDWLSIEDIESLRSIFIDSAKPGEPSDSTTLSSSATSSRPAKLGDSTTSSESTVSGDLVIGAGVTSEQIWSSELCNLVPALQQAARVVGGWQIQNRASLGGNLANASPAADMVVPLIAYGASVELQSRNTTRTLPISEFLLGPRKTALLQNEIITAIRIPQEVLGTPQTFLRLDQRGGTDISLVSVAAVMAFHPHAGTNGVNPSDVKWTRLAVGAANPVPFSLPEVDKLVTGRLSDETVAEAARKYAAHANPITDIRASAEYRTSMVEVFIKKAVKKVVALLGEGDKRVSATVLSGDADKGERA